jgi:hypothetical protein
VVESFCGTLQPELLDRQSWATRQELANAIFEYIEGWYNPHRRHSTIGMLSRSRHHGMMHRNRPENRVKLNRRSRPSAYICEAFIAWREPSRDHRAEFRRRRSLCLLDRHQHPPCAALLPAAVGTGQPWTDTGDAGAAERGGATRTTSATAFHGSSRAPNAAEEVTLDIPSSDHARCPSGI